MSADAPTPMRVRGAGWVALVVVIGALVGGALAAGTPTMPAPPGPGHGGPSPGQYQWLAIVLGAVDSALLLALLIVYVRTYAETRARFALGLLVVFAALFLQTVAGSPAVSGRFGVGPGGLGPFLLLAALFEAIAFAVFLFLSLE
ncbi:MAG TPA: hypothetical protein VML53_02300 [Thermoplasmata archaeon]|nr:hypothetical protein [Thermoplasmata archaeon]